MKKVILIIVFVLVIGLGIGGTIYFYIQNKNQIESNNQLQAQNAQIQSELNAIGSMVECYEVNKQVYSGNEVLEGDLVPVSVPASTLAEASITDKNLLIGRHYRVDIKQGTILSEDMLMKEDETTSAKFPFELTLESLPVSSVDGDYIDIRLLLANGEEYIVLGRKQIQSINGTTITLNVSEEENAILISMFSDLGIYGNGCVAYATKHLEPGNQESIAMYPVQKDMERFMEFNPNIKDITRCVNPTLREHIDEVLLIYTSDKNASQAGSFISAMKGQLTGQLAARESWLEKHTDDEGNIIGENGQVTQGGSTQTTPESMGESFDAAVGDAMEDLENSMEDLEAIE